ncbi:hypothetical protein [Peribacillus kribbensis]|uniref:hypothetical protein n=1 Tax=Peribacillus kribbensis TaxID=356658 RepID=UPI000419B4A4|nr:hypothetical protein [Peribacillus kribbensis]
MLIKRCIGYELEKELPTTSEDFFNRSEVHYVDEGKEKSLSVLYVRTFDSAFFEWLSIQEGPVFTAAGRDVHVKDLAALAALVKNPAFHSRKRVYINQEKAFIELFKGMDLQGFAKVFERMEDSGYILSPKDFISQTTVN